MCIRDSRQTGSGFEGRLPQFSRETSRQRETENRNRKTTGRSRDRSRSTISPLTREKFALHDSAYFLLHSLTRKIVYSSGDCCMPILHKFVRVNRASCGFTWGKCSVLVVDWLKSESEVGEYQLRHSKNCRVLMRSMRPRTRAFKFIIHKIFLTFVEKISMLCIGCTRYRNVAMLTVWNLFVHCLSDVTWK